MKIAVFSAKPFEIECLKQANTTGHDLHFFPDTLNLHSTALASGFPAISTFTNDDASADVLRKLQSIGVQYIATRATGYDNIALPQAKALNIQVANVPEYSPYAIAEHAVALILGLNRKLIQADRQVRAHNFLLDDLIGFDLNGKTIGIIGCGKIGSVLAKIMHGFGCLILVHDPVQNETLQKQYAAVYTTLDAVIQQSDILSIHIPLNSETKYLFNEALIQKMKKGVMLINTGRGGVLDTAAAMEGVKSGQIGYLGLDVYEKEKGMFFFDHSKDPTHDPIFEELISLPNVLVTGHQAFLTQTALKNIADTTLYNLTCWENGVSGKNVLTA